MADRESPATMLPEAISGPGGPFVPPRDPPGVGTDSAARGALLVGLLAAAAFAGTLGYGFVWDDAMLIRDNHYIKYARHIPDFFTRDYFFLSHGVIAQGFYRPFLALSFFADYRLWGLNPAGYHLTNLLFHAGTTALVLLLALRLTGEVTAGALAGVLFALHPVHIESVAFISARVDVIAAVFFLGGVLLFLRGSRPAAWASAACYGAALLMKEMAITLPAVLLLVAGTIGRGPRLRDRLTNALRALIPHAIVLLGYGLLRLQVSLPHLFAGKGAGAADPLSRVLTAVGVVGRYVRLSLWPGEPRPYYELPLLSDPFAPPVLIGLAILALAGSLLAWSWPRRSGVFFGLAWFFITILPASNLLPIPGTRPAVMAERYLYIPSIGICLALGAAGARLAAWAGRRGRVPAPWVAGGLLVVAAGIYGPATVRWTPIWRDEEALYRQMVRRSPQAGFPYLNLAAVVLACGRLGEAEALATRGLAVDPTRADGYRVLAAIRRAGGDREGALAALRQAQGLAPGSVPLLIQLGSALAEGGELEGGLATLGQALRLDPQAVEAYNRMGAAYAEAGRLPEAVQAFRRAGEISPDFLAAHYNLALTLSRMGRDAEALEELGQALRIAPEEPRTLHLLARTLDRLGRHQEAEGIRARLQRMGGREQLFGGGS